MGGTGEAMAVLVYEWRSLSEEGQAQVLALRDTYEQIWLTVLGEASAMPATSRVTRSSGGVF